MNCSVILLLDTFLDNNFDDGINIMISVIIRFELFDVFDMQKLRLRLSMAGILDLIDSLRSLRAGQKLDSDLIASSVFCAVDFLSKPQKCFAILVYHALSALSRDCDTTLSRNILKFLLSDNIPKSNIFPFHAELQHLFKQLEFRLGLNYFNQHWCVLFFQFAKRGRIVDFLLMFVSSMVSGHISGIKAPSFHRACELSMHRLSWLCGQSESVFSSCLDSSRETDNCWTSLLDDLDASFEPTSHSEWIFYIYHNCIKHALSDLFVALDALLPVVLSDPICVEPILPLIMAYCCTSYPEIAISIKASALKLCSCLYIDESFMVLFPLS